MSVYKCVLKGNILGQEWANVFFYGLRSITGGFLLPENSDESANAADLVEVFETDVLPAYRALCTPDTVFESVEAIDLFAPGDSALADLGSVLGTNANPTTFAAHDALALKLETEGNVGRPGAKRITGIPSSFFADGLLASGSPVTLSAALAAAIGAELDSPNVNADYRFAPVVVRRIFEEIIETASKKYRKYRLPETALECVLAAIVAVLVQIFGTTQKSRQQGT